MKRRIALVTHDYQASGGVGTMTRFLYHTLVESGEFEPEIVSLALSAADPASLCARSPVSWRQGLRCHRGSRDGVPFVHYGAYLPEFEFQRYRPRNALTTALNAYDLVQFVVGTPPWICAAAQVARPKFLWTATLTRADRLARLQSARPLKRFWLSIMTVAAENYERRGLRIASEVFALSHYTLAAVRKLLGPHSGILATCGVDTGFFQPPQIRADKCILCVGRLDDPRKNIALLVEAYARTRRRVPQAPELWLVGPPPPADALRLIREHGLTDTVRLLGPKGPADLRNIYQEAAVFALSSDEEGLGIVLLEAMATGLPVVSTACGGPETIVENERTGLLVPTADAGAFAAALERLVTNPDLRRHMGDRGRTTVAERFSLAATGRVFLGKYAATLSKGRRLGLKPEDAGQFAEIPEIRG